MGRKSNYGWEKRQRELKKRKKKEAKAEKKRMAREAAAEEAGEGGANVGTGDPNEPADGDQPGNGPVSEDLPDAESRGDPAVPEDRAGPAQD